MSVVGDGRKGWPQAAPYDAIHVGAAAREIPQELFDQLRPNGLRVIPAGGDFGQVFWFVKKEVDGRMTKKALMEVRYVPLTSVSDQRHGLR